MSERLKDYYKSGTISSLVFAIGVVILTFTRYIPILFGTLTFFGLVAFNYFCLRGLKRIEKLER